MGRGKIENEKSREVKFSKKTAALSKMAHKLAVLCEAEVAVIIFSDSGKLFEFTSSSMKETLSRYKECLNSIKVPSEEHKTEMQETKEVDVLDEDIEEFELKQLQLFGKDLACMGLQELHALEQQLNEGLLCINKTKEQMLMQQLAQSRMQEERAGLENETLRRQVEELRAAFHTTTSYPTPLCSDSHSSVKNKKGS